MDHNIDPLLNEKELSAWLGISVPSIQRLRTNGCGPAFVRLSERRLGYRKSEVEAWLKTRTATRLDHAPEPEEH
jgi:predicted DNA-binding transcriptional regulator AlpA